MTYIYNGTITHCETYAEVARIGFSISRDGKDSFFINDGILYLYEKGELIRVASTFDIKIG